MTCAIAASSKPASLAAVESLWRSVGGRPLGVVGSRSHRHGYHLGKPRLYAFGNPYYAGVNPDGTCAEGYGDADYSVHDFARDHKAASIYAAAIDLGAIPGYGPGKAYDDFAKWLIAECRLGKPDTLGIRAVNYETLRWDRVRGQGSGVYTNGTINEAGHVHVEHFRDTLGGTLTGPYHRWIAYRLLRKVTSSGGQVWTQPDASSIAKGPLPLGATVVAVATVAGGSWSFGGKSGSKWYRVSRIDGHTVQALYGVPYVYAAVGRF